MTSKICLSFSFVLGLLGQPLLAKAGPLSGEGSLLVTNVDSSQEGVVRKFTIGDLPEDRLGRKAIRGRDPYQLRESLELQELRKFEEALVEEEKAEQEGPKVDSSKEILLNNPNVDRSLIRKIMQIKNPPKGYVRFEDRVLKYIAFYQNDSRGRSILTSWLKRQGRYRTLIESVLKEHGLPLFLLYVAMIESGYDPHDRSNKGAVGLWQFMPEGARIYGLRVDYWVDERKDPLRATEAVARYFEDLHERFGSWHLSLAAFNAGYGAVLRSIQKYNTNDYWKLARFEDGLPQETNLYVPKAIATAVVGENLDLFDYPEFKVDPPLEFDQLVLTQSISLANIAKILGTSEEELARLNPHLRRGRIPPLAKGETWTIYIPSTKQSKTLLAQRIEKEAKEELRPYLVPFGKRPEEIAADLGISRSLLWQINGIEERADIRGGMTLLVPNRLKPARSQNEATREEDLVIVAVPDKNFTVPGRKQIFYRVIYGDTISAIAQFFKVKQPDLAKWNHLDLDATLATHMVLSLWVPKDFDAGQAVLLNPDRVLLVTAGSEEFMDAVEARKGRKRLSHLCQEGETLETIAKQYHLTVPNLERINGLGRSTPLKAGQSIVIYQSLSPNEQKQAIEELWKVRGQDEAAREKKSTASAHKVAMVSSDESVSAASSQATEDGEAAAQAAPRSEQPSEEEQSPPANQRFLSMGSAPLASLFFFPALTISLFPV